MGGAAGRVAGQKRVSDPVPAVGHRNRVHSHTTTRCAVERVRRGVFGRVAGRGVAESAWGYGAWGCGAVGVCEERSARSPDAPDETDTLVMRPSEFAPVKFGMPAAPLLMSTLPSSLCGESAVRFTSDAWKRCANGRHVCVHAMASQRLRAKARRTASSVVMCSDGWMPKASRRG